MLLWRPVGLRELALMHGSRMTAFPPRLPEQPIFYPVLNEAYATQIAPDWNTRAAPFAGYVTRFDVDDVYVGRFERRIVGARQHEELPAFNARLREPIEAVSAFFGADFVGDPLERDPRHHLHALVAARRRDSSTDRARREALRRPNVRLNGAASRFTSALRGGTDRGTLPPR